MGRAIWYSDLWKSRIWKLLSLIWQMAAIFGISGMFVWKSFYDLRLLQRSICHPPMTDLLKIKDAVGTPQEQDTVLEKEFPNLESQSVDYGIMEKAENIYTLAGNFGWDDVGSWLAVGRIKQNRRERQCRQWQCCYSQYERTVSLKELTSSLQP